MAAARMHVKRPCAAIVGALPGSAPGGPHRCRAASTNPATATSATATNSHGIGP